MQPAGNCPSNLTGEMVKRLITYIKCAGGLTCCNGVCRLLYVDPANCGACGRVVSRATVMIPGTSYTNLNLVTHSVQLAPSAVVVTVSALLIITNQPVATSV